MGYGDAMIKLILGLAALVIIILACLGVIDVQALLYDAINAFKDMVKTLLEGVL